MASRRSTRTSSTKAGESPKSGPSRPPSGPNNRARDLASRLSVKPNNASGRSRKPPTVLPPTAKGGGVSKVKPRRANSNAKATNVPSKRNTEPATPPSLPPIPPEKTSTAPAPDTAPLSRRSRRSNTRTISNAGRGIGQENKKQLNNSITNLMQSALLEFAPSKNMFDALRDVTSEPMDSTTNISPIPESSHIDIHPGEVHVSQMAPSSLTKMTENENHDASGKDNITLSPESRNTELESYDMLVTNVQWKSHDIEDTGSVVTLETEVIKSTDAIDGIQVTETKGTTEASDTIKVPTSVSTASVTVINDSVSMPADEASASIDGEDFISLSSIPDVNTNIKNAFEKFELESKDKLLGFDSEDSDDSITNLNNGRSDTENFTNCPWMRNMKLDPRKSIPSRLTEEIKLFASYMSPTDEEFRNRLEVFHSITDAAKSRWPRENISTYIFGSFATNLYLPGSDVDMVMFANTSLFEQKSSLFQLSHVIRTRGIATKIEVISKARVPIIKIKDAKYGINVDISFSRVNGVQAVDNIIDWLIEFPCLRPLSLVIKRFLANRRFNEVRFGGLGGFSLICMIVSFLKNHPKVSSGEINPDENLGTLLIEFFELYGLHFNFEELIVETHGDMAYSKKRDSLDLVEGDLNSLKLVIRDPNDASNNIARSSFNVTGMINNFKGAFKLLTAACYEMDSAGPSRKRESILASIVNANNVKPRGFETQTRRVPVKFRRLNKPSSNSNNNNSRNNSGNKNSRSNDSYQKTRASSTTTTTSIGSHIAAVSLTDNDQHDGFGVYHHGISSDEDDDGYGNGGGRDSRRQKRAHPLQNRIDIENDDSDSDSRKHHIYGKRVRFADDDSMDSRTRQVSGSSRSDRRSYWNGKALSRHAEIPIRDV